MVFFFFFFWILKPGLWAGYICHHLMLCIPSDTQHFFFSLCVMVESVIIIALLKKLLYTDIICLHYPNPNLTVHQTHPRQTRNHFVSSEKNMYLESWKDMILYLCFTRQTCIFPGRHGVSKKWACICFSPCSTCCRHDGTLCNDCYLLRTGDTTPFPVNNTWRKWTSFLFVVFLFFLSLWPCYRAKLYFRLEKAKIWKLQCLETYALDWGSGAWRKG